MAGMSDAEVQGQIAHMIAFIDQEASEKVEEIDAKAEEEFNLEKGRLVQTARAKIIDFYDKKIKQVELQKKIQQSNLLNASRLQVLKVKEGMINQIFDENKQILSRVSQDDPEKYRTVMLKLTLQSLIRMLEPRVVVQVKQVDIPLMKQLLPEIQAQYSTITKGKEVQLTVNEENCLQPDLIGGVVLSAHGDKISIDNTLDERLKLVSNKMQPEVREMVFGPNPNRKFKD